MHNSYASAQSLIGYVLRAQFLPAQFKRYIQRSLLYQLLLHTRSRPQELHIGIDLRAQPKINFNRRQGLLLILLMVKRNKYRIFSIKYWPQINAVSSRKFIRLKREAKAARETKQKGETFPMHFSRGFAEEQKNNFICISLIFLSYIGYMFLLHIFTFFS